MEKQYRNFTKSEEKWISEFKKVMARAPKDLFMFVGAGSVVIYADRVMTGDRYKTGDSGVDGNNTNVHIKTKMICDGGDW